MAQQYIGSLISLTSKSDIRYQGILHSIDPVEATVSLEKVRSLGTEGRKANPAEEISANDNVYDFIIFRAADVKDLKIEAPAPEAAPQPPMNDPAIVATAAPPAAAGRQQLPPHPQQQQQQPNQQQQQQRPPFAQHPSQQQQYGAYYPPQPSYPDAPTYPPYGFPPPQHFGPPGSFGAPGFGPPGGALPYPGQQVPQGFGGQSQGLSSPSASSAVGPSPVTQKAEQPKPATSLSPPAPAKAQPVAPPAAVAPPQAKAPAPLTTNGAAARPPPPATASPVVAKAASPIVTKPIAPAAAAAPKPRSYANPGPPIAPTTKKDVMDVEQLAKDMSRANMGARRPSASAGNEGVSVFGLAPNARRAQPAGAGRQLLPFGALGAQAPEVPRSDFDFASSNANFKKDLGGEQEEVVIPAAPEMFYDKKSSFFDSISSDIKSRSEGVGMRGDRGAERNKNLDTFGESGGSAYGGYGGRGRRGGRRGGYGGGGGGYSRPPVGQ